MEYKVINGVTMSHSAHQIFEKTTLMFGLLLELFSSTQERTEFRDVQQILFTSFSEVKKIIDTPCSKNISQDDKIFNSGLAWELLVHLKVLSDTLVQKGYIDKYSLRMISIKTKNLVENFSFQ